MEYNLDVADDDSDELAEEGFVNSSVADASSLDNFDAMALQVLSNIS